MCTAANLVDIHMEEEGNGETSWNGEIGGKRQERIGLSRKVNVLLLMKWGDSYRQGKYLKTKRREKAEADRRDC